LAGGRWGASLVVNGGMIGGVGYDWKEYLIIYL
jgi:hypothetical protein